MRQLAKTVLAAHRLRVADIGALWGLLPELEPIAEWVDAVGYDPDPDECARLNERALQQGVRHRFYPFAIAGSDGTRSFHELRKASSSSVLPPNEEFHRRFHNAEGKTVAAVYAVKTRSLGSALAESGFQPELLKLDAHGLEVEILESLAGSQWDSIVAVHTEALFAEHYQGQCFMGEIDSLLRRQGFELFGLKRYVARREGFDTVRYATRGQVSFADCLYMRPDGDDRLAVVAAAFGHNDFAASIATPEVRRLILANCRRPSLLVRRAARAMVLVGMVGRRLYGAPAGPWGSDADPL